MEGNYDGNFANPTGLNNDENYTLLDDLEDYIEKEDVEETKREESDEDKGLQVAMQSTAIATSLLSQLVQNHLSVQVEKGQALTRSLTAKVSETQASKNDDVLSGNVNGSHQSFKKGCQAKAKDVCYVQLYWIRLMAHQISFTCYRLEDGNGNGFVAVHSLGFQQTLTLQAVEGREAGEGVGLQHYLAPCDQG